MSSEPRRVSAREVMIHRLEAARTRVAPGVWLDDLDGVEAEAVAAYRADLIETILGWNVDASYKRVSEGGSYDPLLRESVVLRLLTDGAEPPEPTDG